MRVELPIRTVTHAGFALVLACVIASVLSGVLVVLAPVPMQPLILAFWGCLSMLAFLLLVNISVPVVKIILATYLGGFVLLDSFLRNIVIVGSLAIPNGLISAWRDVAAAALLIVAFRILMHRTRLARPAPVDWVVLLWLGNALAGSVMTQDLELTLRALRITYAPAVIYLCLRLLPVDRSVVEWITRYILALSTILAMSGLYMSFVLPQSVLLDWSNRAFGMAGGNMGAVLYRVGLTRMTSFLFSPTPFGALMGGAAVISFAHALRSTTIKYWMLLFLFSFCNFFSLSRGPWLLQLCGMAAVWVYSRPSGRSVTRALLALVLGIAIALGAANLLLATYKPGGIASSSEIMHALSDPEELYGRGAKHRMRVYLSVFGDLARYPLGHGVGMVGRVAARGGDNLRFGTPSVSDGWFAKIAAETGFLGLFSYILLAGAVLWALFRYRRSQPAWIQPHLSSLVGLFLGMQALGFVSNAWDLEPIAPIVWSLLAVVLTCILPLRVLDPQAPSKNLPVVTLGG